MILIKKHETRPTVFMTVLEASVISMHFGATTVKFDQSEGISAGFQCISVSVRSNNVGSHTAHFVAVNSYV